MLLRNSAMDIASVDISDVLRRRPTTPPDYVSEKLAISDLMAQVASRPEYLLPKLTDHALELCDADSAGVSVLEGEVFRWQGLRGVLAVFEGANTPRNDSPCGVCIDRHRPIVMERPERVYSWIAEAKISVPELLLVPIFVEDHGPLGTLWVVAREGQQFDGGHARMLSELAVFVGTALRIIKADRTAKGALAQQELLARELSHRIKNFFAVTDSLVRMTARHSDSKEELVDNLLGRLSALSDAHALSLGHRSEEDHEPVALRTIIETVLRPYREAGLSGPQVLLSRSATSSLTLVLHELATNASKHGALAALAGEIRIEWRVDDGKLHLVWKESGGAPIAGPPARMGFGTTLLRSSLAGMGGTIEKEWSRDGLLVKLALPSSCFAD